MLSYSTPQVQWKRDPQATISSGLFFVARKQRLAAIQRLAVAKIQCCSESKWLVRESGPGPPGKRDLEA